MTIGQKSEGQTSTIEPLNLSKLDESKSMPYLTMPGVVAGRDDNNNKMRGLSNNSQHQHKQSIVSLHNHSCNDGKYCQGGCGTSLSRGVATICNEEERIPSQ